MSSSNSLAISMPRPAGEYLMAQIISHHLYICRNAYLNRPAFASKYPIEYLQDMLYRAGERDRGEPYLLNIYLHAARIHNVSHHERQFVAATMGLRDKVSAGMAWKGFIVLFQQFDISLYSSQRSAQFM